MAFPKEAVRTPVSIADISIDLFDPDPTGTEAKAASFTVQVRMSDGSTVVRTGNLLLHITTAQRNSLQNFMTNLRAQAVAESLPP